MLLIFIVTTTLKTIHSEPTYTTLSATNDINTTVQQTTKRSTLSKAETSSDLPTTATTKVTSLIYSPLLTTEQSTTIKTSTPRYTSKLQVTTEDSEAGRQTTSKSTSQPSKRQSSTTIAMNKKPGTSHQSKRTPHCVNLSFINPEH